MNTHEMQKILIDSIENVVQANIKKINTTNSTIGIVKEIPLGYDTVVEINEERFECLMPEHMHSWIQKGDIVIVQDLYNDGRKLVVTGKVGETQESPSLVFYDEEQERIISGVDGAFEGEDFLDTRESILE